VFRAKVVMHFCRSSEVNGASILLQKALVSTIVGSNLDVVCFHAKSVFGYLFSPIDLSASSQPDIASFLLSLLQLPQSKLLSNMKKFVGFKELHSLVFDIMSGMFKQFSKKQRDRSLENLIQRGFCGDVCSNRPLQDFCEMQSIEDIGNLFLYSFFELLEMLQSEHDYKESTDFSFDGCVEFARKCIELFDCDVLTELVSKTDVNGKDFLCILTEMCFEWPMFGERRSRLLSLLSTLCLGMDSNMNFLMTKLEVYINILSPRPNLLTKWHSNENGSETELVGLKNQGATCYMNSLFQQLFYLSDFRDRVLTLNLPINQIEIDSSDNRLLHCLQDMFRTMLISRSQNFDTMELINVLPKNGESICVNEQQDVEEFLNMFTDRMESTLSSTADPNLMSDIFGGKLSHLITCKRCGFTSERIEDSRSISLDIRGHTSLESSLSGFIQEEFLNGDNQYFCSKCNERQDSMKRCCFNDLPKILVCHLKRFSFNLETLKRVKINDRFEFSTTLDLEPFTKKMIYANENIESENLIYTLQGVIIHAGSSDSGHYYSLAKVQPSGIQKYGISTNLSNVKKEGWFCFNDTITTPFDMNSLEHEAFGGLNVKHNAYILVYAKNLRDDQFQVTLHSQNWNPTAIIEENKSLAQSKILFSRQLEIFIKKVCTSEALTREMMIRAVRILSMYVFEFHVHSFTTDSNEVLKSFSTLLHLHNCDSSLEAGFDYFRTISSSHQLYLEKMLLYCDHKELRGAFMHFISSLYDSCKKNRGKLDFIEDNGDEIEHCEFDCDDDVQIIQIDGVIRKRLGRIQYWKSNSVLERFKGCLFDLIDICVPHWRRCETLFELLDVLARKSHEESIWMIRSGVILRVLDIYLRDTSVHIPQTSIPRRKHNSNSSLTHKSVGHRRRKPCMKEVLSLLRTLVCSAQKPDTNQIDEVSDSSESENESDSLTCEIKSPARSPYLTENAKKRFDEVIYFLPIRDARILASKDFIQKLESERQEANDSDSNEVAAIIDQMINHLNF
jgi:ubiquitin C-terminal hydrolase